MDRPLSSLPSPLPLLRLHRRQPNEPPQVIRLPDQLALPLNDHVADELRELAALVARASPLRTSTEPAATTRSTCTDRVQRRPIVHVAPRGIHQHCDEHHGALRRVILPHRPNLPALGLCQEKVPSNWPARQVISRCANSSIEYEDGDHQEGNDAADKRQP